MELDSKSPTGPIETRWDRHRFNLKLVNPANKRKHTIIVVGTGLAGGAAAATLGELGYNVKCFCFQDSPRRAHSIAAQGGINAAKNYHNDGDSVYRLFYDTIKGGDFRAREANVFRLAQVSAAIIDQCVAQGVPFAREYGGQLTNRSSWPDEQLIGDQQREALVPYKVFCAENGVSDPPRLCLVGKHDLASVSQLFHSPIRFADLRIIVLKIAANCFLPVANYDADLDDSRIGCLLHDVMNHRSPSHRKHFFGGAVGQR